LLKSQGDIKGDQWDVVEFPAILPNDKPVWPEYWKREELETVKASISIGKWNAQYMQTPTAEEGAIIKREWWKDWPYERPPQLSFIIQSYDTAFLKKETADYSAITTWGVFNKEGDGQHAILLDAFKGRYEFPELRRLAHQEYLNWNPDIVIIEAKASGIPLIHELRQKDIPISEFTPSKGNDKHVRMNSISHLFQQGRVWAPKHKSFAQEVIEECAAFPHGDNDDYVDSMTQAIMRLRQGYFLTHPEDYKDVVIDRTGVTYYG
jgi:predicted phage terminase large subunit-like protein